MPKSRPTSSQSSSAPSSPSAPSASQSLFAVYSQNTSPSEFIQSPRFTFFNDTRAASSSIRLIGRRPGYVTVVDIDGLETDIIRCQNEKIIDLLCAFIPLADDHILQLLARVQSVRLGRFADELTHLRAQTIQTEQRAASLVRELRERQEDIASAQLLTPLAQLTLQPQQIGSDGDPFASESSDEDSDSEVGHDECHHFVSYDV